MGLLTYGYKNALSPVRSRGRENNAACVFRTLVQT